MFEWLRTKTNELDDLKRRNAIDMSNWKRDGELALEEARNTLRATMQEALIKSDLSRVKAEASLAAYKEMDAKNDHQKVVDYLGKAIDGLSKQKVQVITPSGKTE